MPKRDINKNYFKKSKRRGNLPYCDGDKYNWCDGDKYNW